MPLKISWLLPTNNHTRQLNTSIGWILCIQQRSSKSQLKIYLPIILILCLSHQYWQLLERTSCLVNTIFYQENMNLYICIYFYGYNFWLASWHLFTLDIIGHVVEKGIVKETEKNGQQNKVMDLTLEDLE